jgi:hypothetical protein
VAQDLLAEMLPLTAALAAAEAAVQTKPQGTPL